MKIGIWNASPFEPSSGNRRMPSPQGARVRVVPEEVEGMFAHLESFASAADRCPSCGAPVAG